MNTAITITAIICISLVLILAMFMAFSFVLNSKAKEKDLAYWRGFADAVKLEKEEDKNESAKVNEL